MFNATDFGNNMQDYFTKIGLDNENTTIEDLTQFQNDFGLSQDNMGEPMSFNKFTNQKFSWTQGSPVTDTLDI